MAMQEKGEGKTDLVDLCSEGLFECREIEWCYIGVRNKGIDRCRECCEDGMCDVWDQVKTTVYGVTTEDGHFQDVRRSVHCLTSQGGEMRNRDKS
jgi:hypothetical protein